jgi:hypothetical protein
MRNKGKVFFGVLGLAFALTAIAGAKPAEAAVPGWARTFHGTRMDVFGCSLEAQFALEDVTGGTVTRTKIDNFSYEIRGFTSNVGIFVYCTASQVNICPSRPRANLVILTFSSQGSGDAAAKRDAVNTAIGDPQLIDCN